MKQKATLVYDKCMKKSFIPWVPMLFIACGCSVSVLQPKDASTHKRIVAPERDALIVHPGTGRSSKRVEKHESPPNSFPIRNPSDDWRDYDPMNPELKVRKQPK